MKHLPPLDTHVVLPLLFCITILHDTVHICFVCYVYWHNTYFCVSCLAPFEIKITAHSIQQVGSPLTLDCSIKEVDVFNGPLEIMWTTNTTILQRTNVMATVMDSSSIYTDSYTITQLTTSDHGRVIQCIANRTSPPVVDNGNITLNIIGKLKGSKY